MKAKSLDKEFNEGKDVSQYLNLSKARRPNQDQKRVNGMGRRTAAEGSVASKGKYEENRNPA